jgi:DNA-binding LacI/PurR family transcriptional regulator
MAVTISDVAQAAGVSKGAVSYALNGQPGVSDATRERILQAAKELGWKPSLRAKGLSSAKAYALGLVVARDPKLLGTDPFFPAFIAGIETTLAEHDYTLVLSVRLSQTGRRRQGGRRHPHRRAAQRFPDRFAAGAEAPSRYPQPAGCGFPVPCRVHG